MSKTAKQVAGKIVALLVGDYMGKWEIESVNDYPYGQTVRVRDVNAEESFVVTVQKFNDGPAVEAQVERDAEQIVIESLDGTKTTHNVKTFYSSGIGDYLDFEQPDDKRTDTEREADEQAQVAREDTETEPPF
jgi:hypothetical protein